MTVARKQTKTKKPALEAMPQSTSARMAAFYAGKLTKVEDSLQLVSNSIVEPKRVSSGVLCVDWLFGGGFIPGMSSIAGEEASGKTTTLYHTLANAKATLQLPYNGFYDAEGTVSTRYTKRIWEPFGLNVEELLSKAGRTQGFYYFRDQVIERMFDYLKQTLDLMPDKNWNSEAKAWCYYFPKRDEHFKELMNIMEVKPSRALSGGAFYVVPTENAGPEGFFGCDSFAAMLTKEEGEKDESGKTRSAMEAAEFSKQLKRVVVPLAEKKVVMLGTNQLRSHVRQQYGHPDDQKYENGGEALKFYSLARGRYFSRAASAASKYMSFFTVDKDNSKFALEDSVEFPGGKDRYAYKELKNTKNKFGKPGLRIFTRVWVSDAKGNPRGVDPAFDVFNYLLQTGQIKVEKGGKLLRFRLKASAGKTRASLLNSLPPISFLDFKALIVSEYTNNEELFRRTVKKLGINKRLDLRAALFKQLTHDESMYSNIREDALVANEDMEDSDSDSGIDYEDA